MSPWCKPLGLTEPRTAFCSWCLWQRHRVLPWGAGSFCLKRPVQFTRAAEYLGLDEVWDACSAQGTSQGSSCALWRHWRNSLHFTEHWIVVTGSWSLHCKEGGARPVELCPGPTVLQYFYPTEVCAIIVFISLYWMPSIKALQMHWRTEWRAILTNQKSGLEKMFENTQQVLPQQEQSVPPTQPEALLAGDTQCCRGSGGLSLSQQHTVVRKVNIILGNSHSLSVLCGILFLLKYI